MLAKIYPKLESLADSNRIKILDMFNDVSELTPSLISASLGISSPLCTHHVNILKKTGFVTVRRSGRIKIITRNKEAFENLSVVFSQIALLQDQKEKEKGN